MRETTQALHMNTQEVQSFACQGVHLASTAHSHATGSPGDMLCAGWPVENPDRGGCECAVVEGGGTWQAVLAVGVRAGVAAEEQPARALGFAVTAGACVARAGEAFETLQVGRWEADAGGVICGRAVVAEEQLPAVPAQLAEL